ncbi:MAG: hypothetical protein AAGA23_04230 [Pseudomonadota bacterium]
MNLQIERSGTGAIGSAEKRGAKAKFFRIGAVLLLALWAGIASSKELKADGLTLTISEFGHVAAVWNKDSAGGFLVGSGKLEDGFVSLAMLGAESLAKVDGAGTGRGKVDGAGTGRDQAKVDGAGTGRGQAKVDGAGTGRDKVDGAGTGRDKTEGFERFALDLVAAQEGGYFAVIRKMVGKEQIRELVFDFTTKTPVMIEETITDL